MLIFVYNKSYYQESYILIIEYNSEVTVTEWFDGKFSKDKKKDEKFWKSKRPAVVRYLKIPLYVYHVFKTKTVKG